jgi:hypothetical protein
LANDASLANEWINRVDDVIIRISSVIEQIIFFWGVEMAWDY